MKLFGLEAEYLLEQPDTVRALHDLPPWVVKEFFEIMIEVVTDPLESAAGAVAQLRERVQGLETLNGTVRLGHSATLPDHTTWTAGWNQVTSHTPYYRWVYEVACRDPFWLHPVGFHPNYSDTRLTEDRMVRAVNALRCLNFLFILVTANSPSVRHQCLSARSAFFPNRYDPPFWISASHFREWIRREEAEGRIYMGKARCWMACCPRLRDNDPDQPIERIELRSLDSGRAVPFETLQGCFELMERITQESGRASRLPALHSELRENDRAVAYLGRGAKVNLRRGTYSALDVARHWCRGIESLERVLEEGSPAEQALRN